MNNQEGLFEPESAGPVVVEQMSRGAVLSDCGTYRYELTRVWNPTLPQAGFVMLNPSKADGRVDDPTISVCIRFTRFWGYGGFVVRNLFALRATNPVELRTHPEPIGPRNGEYLRRCVDDAVTIVAWGTHGALNGRADAVVSMLRHYGANLYHLGLTKDGYPKHPLARGRHRIPRDTMPIPWKAASS